LNIRVDYREKASGLCDLLKREGVSLEIKKVPYGDYVINDSITVERKTAKDFLISIIDGRLFNQLSNRKKHCRRPVLLIEGNPYKTELNFDPTAIKGASYPHRPYGTSQLYSLVPRKTQRTSY
jgi:ERCC4-type nuclease